ncbi:hypothetical protein [Glutamicibacter ardleyensis]
MIGGGALALLILGVVLWTLGSILDPKVENASNNPVQILMDQGRGYLPAAGLQITVFAICMLLIAVILMLVVV